MTQRCLMALSQAYREWKQQTEQRGMERGIKRGIEQGEYSERQKTITSILTIRFGALDHELPAIIPTLLELPIEIATPLLLQLTRE